LLAVARRIKFWHVAEQQDAAAEQPEGDARTAEQLWEEGLAEELSIVIQENPCLPFVPVPFDVLSDKPEDDQK
jgi:hypothetical protein